MVVANLGCVGWLWFGQKLSGGWEEQWTSFGWNIRNTGWKERAEARIKQGRQKFRIGETTQNLNLCG